MPRISFFVPPSYNRRRPASRSASLASGPVIRRSNSSLAVLRPRKFPCRPQTRNLPARSGLMMAKPQPCFLLNPTVPMMVSARSPYQSTSSPTTTSESSFPRTNSRNASLPMLLMITTFAFPRSEVCLLPPTKNVSPNPENPYLVNGNSGDNESCLPAKQWGEHRMPLTVR